MTSADRTPMPGKHPEKRAWDLLESGSDMADRIERAIQAREMGKRLRELREGKQPVISDFPYFPANHPVI